MKFILFMAFILLQADSFKQQQQKFNRVKDAYVDKEDIVKGYFAQKKISYQGFHLFLRAFKHDRKVEVWVSHKTGKYTLLHTYDICASSGELGPKRREGDYQVPEGIYQINHFNPASNFHLSLGVNYPNQSDKILSDSKRPGGEIYIHGNCVTVGCLPLTDDKIKELYVLAVEARNNGQSVIPVHIYPTHLNAAGLAFLQQEEGSTNIPFWQNLQKIYQDFEKQHTLKPVKINTKGQYYF